MLKHIFSVFLIGASILLVIATVTGVDEPKRPTFQFERQRHDSIDIDAFPNADRKYFDDVDFSSHEFTMLFLIQPSTCPPCIFEIHEYIDIVDEIADLKSMFLPITVVATTSSDQIDRFKHVSGLDIPLISVPVSDLQKIDSTLTTAPIFNRLWFINNESRIILHEVILPTGGTTPESYKTELFSRVTTMYHNQGSLTGT